MRVAARATRPALPALLLCVASWARAHAQGVSVQDCEALDSAEVSRLITLELATRQAAVERVALRCQALQVSVVVQPTASAPLALDVDLRQTRGEARARVLALAIAELVETARLEPDARPAPPAAAPPPPLRLGLALAAGATRLLQPAVIGPLFGLGLSGRRAALSLDADVALELARVSVEQADVQARLLSVSMAAGWHAASERLDLGLELGLRGAHAQLTAAARAPGVRGTRFSGLSLLPLARATLGMRLSRTLGARLGVEAAYVARPLSGLDADAQSLVALRGLRLTATLAAVLWLDAL